MCYYTVAETHTYTQATSEVVVLALDRPAGQPGGERVDELGEKVLFRYLPHGKYACTTRDRVSRRCVLLSYTTTTLLRYMCPVARGGRAHTLTDTMCRSGGGVQDAEATKGLQLDGIQMMGRSLRIGRCVLMLLYRVLRTHWPAHA